MSSDLFGSAVQTGGAMHMQNKQMLYGIGMTAWANKVAQDAADDAFMKQIYLTRLNQQWQEHMASTAHQREVQDLKMAGLNPILSANGGAPIGSASTPGVNMKDTSMWNDLAKQQVAQQDLNEAQILNLKENAKLMAEERYNETLKSDQIVADTELKNAQKLREQAEATLADKNASWYDRMRAQDILESTSRIELNYATRALKHSETKFTNERSRGRTRTISESNNTGHGIDVKVTGVGHSTNNGWSHTISETY